MTNKEIEEQADKYANEKVAEIRTGKNSYSTLQMWCDRASGFVDGAKWGISNAIEWHDLREDPTNLPKENGEYWGYVNYYGFQHRTIHWSDNQFDIPEVIAWCELPRFKDKE